jgi:hypothetical protein
MKWLDTYQEILKLIHHKFTGDWFELVRTENAPDSGAELTP